MERRVFLQASSLAVLAPSGAAAAWAAGPEPPSSTAESEFGFASPPVLQNPSPDGVTVVWAVRGLSAGWVEYGATPALGQRADGNAAGLLPLDDRVFKIRLHDLRPGTCYYRVCSAPITFKSAYDIRRGEAIASPVHAFKVLDPTAKSASFSVINDTHENRATVARLGDMLEANPTESLIWNGDIFNDIRDEQQIITQALAPAGRALAATAPLLPVRGNHDVRGKGARLLDRFFDAPSGLWFYTLRQGPVAFIVLDTGEDKPDEHPEYGGLASFAAYRTAQQGWLRRAIDRPEIRTAPFRVGIAHIPLVWHDYKQVMLYSPDGKAKWHDLLAEAGIQLLISGHVHKHTWIPAGDAPYAQLTGGGPKQDNATFIQGHADERELRVVVKDLEGRELGAYAFPALA
jgi:predicted phosphodiesterase